MASRAVPYAATAERNYVTVAPDRKVPLNEDKYGYDMPEQAPQGGRWASQGLRTPQGCTRWTPAS